MLHCIRFDQINARAVTYGGTGGTDPPNLSWGHPSPNILRTIGIGCEAKYEVTKDGLH